MHLKAWLGRRTWARSQQVSRTERSNPALCAARNSTPSSSVLSVGHRSRNVGALGSNGAWVTLRDDLVVDDAHRQHAGQSHAQQDHSLVIMEDAIKDNGTLPFSCPLRAPDENQKRDC